MRPGGHRVHDTEDRDRLQPSMPSNEHVVSSDSCKLQGRSCEATQIRVRILGRLRLSLLPRIYAR